LKAANYKTKVGRNSDFLLSLNISVFNLLHKFSAPQFKQKQKPPQRFIKAVLLNAAFYAKVYLHCFTTKIIPKTYQNTQGRKFNVIFGKYSSNSPKNK